MIKLPSHHRFLGLGLTAILALASPVLTACAGSSGAVFSEEIETAMTDPGLYAVMQTTMGDIAIQLFPEEAPITVGNFVGLAEGTKEFKDIETGEMVARPFYDGLKFHRIMKDFMIQGGDPAATGMGGPGYTFIDEADNGLVHDGPGVLSMANAGPNTNGSQFFVTHKATPWLDGKHTVFGRVVSGQEFVDAMGQVEMSGPQNSTPVADILLTTLKIVRKGDAAEGFDAAAAFAKMEELQAAAEAARAAELESALSSRGIDAAQVETTPEGLQYVVVEAGTGAQPTKGQTIVAHYSGFLTDGTKFDSSVDRGQPFETPIGVGRVIPGWDIAFQAMKVGEKRLLIISPDLGYGTRGSSGVIPPNATLLFDVELLEVKP